MSDPVILPQPVFQVQRSAERAFYDHGWLRSFHSFSFADYYDPRNVNWGALRVFNDDRVAPGKGFGTHPHRDMEILTYVLSGQLEHRDSLGSHGVVGPGGVQFMSAGTGVQHSEFNHSTTEELHFLQMWVLPGRLGEKPLYGQLDFDVAARSGKWLTVASGQPGVAAPVLLTQDATFKVSRIAGQTLQHTFAPGRLGFLFVADGVASAAGVDEGKAPVDGEVLLAAGDGVRIAGVSRLTLSGAGEVALWDVPRPPDDAND
jgi:redox-sensitive bicupin YhaK (pirin superfamily)